MTDPAPAKANTAAHAAAVAPILNATVGCVITGAGFLPDHRVTVCVTYTEDDISDYLRYATGPGGELHAELPTSPAIGVLHITATDHRTDPDGPCGLLWSNTQNLQPPHG